MDEHCNNIFKKHIWILTSNSGMMISFFGSQLQAIDVERKWSKGPDGKFQLSPIMSIITQHHHVHARRNLF